MKKYLYLIPMLALMTFAACSKDDDDNNTSSTSSQNVAYLLNEGLLNANGASLSRIDLDNGTIANNYFESTNSRKLGDLGQDIVHYGSKIYIAVAESEVIEVIDAKDARTVKQINMGDRYPRSMAVADGKLYVSCWYPRSVVRIDTASLEIEATCTLSGLNPEGLCVSGGNLYVCNSYEDLGNYEYDRDSTLSVVSIASFTETDKMSIGALNLQNAIALEDGRLVVSYSGDYVANPAGIAVVNLSTGDVSRLDGVSVSGPCGMVVYQNTIYTVGSDYDENWNSVSRFWKINPATLAKEAFAADIAADVKAPYGISINPANGDVFIGDAMDYRTAGDLYWLAIDGTLKHKMEAAMLPKKVCF